MNSIKEKQFEQNLHILETKNKNLELQLNSILNSKTFRYWQKYCDFRKNTVEKIGKAIYRRYWQFKNRNKVKSVFFIPLKNQKNDFPFEQDDLIKANALKSHRFFGYDNILGEYCNFQVDHENFRETLKSELSQTFARQRAMVCGLSKTIFSDGTHTLIEIADYINQNRKRIYTTESNGALFIAMKKVINPALFYYSEYFDQQYQSGKKINGILHEDLQKTSFKDNYFDYILTSDVMEHVADMLKAEKEIVRILKPKGFYIFTVPMYENDSKDTIFASLDSKGEIIYYTPPVYHGNPIDPDKGSLVFRFPTPKEMGNRFQKLNSDYRAYKIWSKDLAILDKTMIINLVQKNYEKNY